MTEISLIRKKQVEALTGRSYTSLRRDMKTAGFPRPIQIGPRAIAWRLADVRAWIDSRSTATLPAVKPGNSTKAE